MALLKKGPKKATGGLEVPLFGAVPIEGGTWRVTIDPREIAMLDLDAIETSKQGLLDTLSSKLQPDYPELSFVKDDGYSALSHRDTPRLKAIPDLDRLKELLKAWPKLNCEYYLAREEGTHSTLLAQDIVIGYERGDYYLKIDPKKAKNEREQLKRAERDKERSKLRRQGSPKYSPTILESLRKLQWSFDIDFSYCSNVRCCSSVSGKLGYIIWWAKALRAANSTGALKTHRVADPGSRIWLTHRKDLIKRLHKWAEGDSGHQKRLQEFLPIFNLLVREGNRILKKIKEEAKTKA